MQLRRLSRCQVSGLGACLRPALHLLDEPPCMTADCAAHMYTVSINLYPSASKITRSETRPRHMQAHDLSNFSSCAMHSHTSTPAKSAEMHEKSWRRNCLSVVALVSCSKRFTSSKSTELG